MRMLLKNFSVIMSNVSAPMNVFIRHRTVLLEQSKPSSNSKYFTRQRYSGQVMAYLIELSLHPCTLSLHYLITWQTQLHSLSSLYMALHTLQVLDFIEYFGNSFLDIHFS